MSQGLGLERAKTAFAIIDPNAVGRLEIVAHIDIGSTVAIEVVKLDGQPHVPRHSGEGQPVGIAKGAFRPWHCCEPAFAVVEVEHVRFAVLDEAAINDLDPVRGRQPYEWTTPNRCGQYFHRSLQRRDRGRHRHPRLPAPWSCCRTWKRDRHFP